MTTRTRKVLLGALMTFAVLVTTLVATSPAQAATYYTIRNAASGKCLAIGGGDQSNGAHAIQWACGTGYTEQQWILDSAYRWRNRYTDKCLAIGGGSGALGAHVIQWTCNTNDDQMWLHNGSGTYRNLATGLCIAIGDHDPSNGAHAIQWSCNAGNADQQWVIAQV